MKQIYTRLIRLLYVIFVFVIESCNEGGAYNELRDVAWIDTIKPIGVRDEYTIREYNKDGLIISSCSYGYLNDDNLKELLKRTYHYLDGKLLCINEKNLIKVQHPNVKYLLHYDQEDRLSEVLFTNVLEDSIFVKSEYKHNENGKLIKWTNTDYSTGYPMKEIFEYVYEANKLVNVIEGDEKKPFEKYEYKKNGNVGRIVNLQYWWETNLIYNENCLVKKCGNAFFKYDNKSRIESYKRIEDMMGDTISFMFLYGERPDNIKDNNRFIDDGGRFANTRGQVYYKLCDFNNNYLPDGLGIREQL